MGFSLMRKLKDNFLTRGVRDVFDANTADDFKRRAQAQVNNNQPVVRQTYQQQQIAQGNKRPYQNLGTAIIGNTARFLNTGEQAKQELLDTARLYGAQLRGDKEDLRSTNQRIKERQQKAYQPNSGFLGAGTIFNSPQEFNTLGAKELTKRVGATTLGTAGEVLPVGKGMTLANQGVRVLPKLAAYGALTNAASDIGNQYISTGKVNPNQVAKSALTGAVLSTAPPLAVAGVKKAVPVVAKGAQKVDEVAFNLPVTRVNLKEQAILRDFSDALVGANKAQGKELSDLITQAQQLGRKYNTDLTNGSIKDRLDRSNAILDSIGKKRPSANVGAIQLGPKPKVALKTPEQIKVAQKETLESIVKPKVTPKTNVVKPVETPTGLATQLKTALVEKDQPIISTLKRVEKSTGKQGLVDQFMYDSGLQSRSASIANQKLTSNPNLKSALRGLTKNELDELNTYSAARSELWNASRGMPTSQPVDQLRAVVDGLTSKYGSRFEGLNKFYKDLAGDLRNAGIIDEARYKQFISSPDYVRIQRDMSDLVNMRGSGGNAYSLGSTVTSKARTGSKRAIQGADTTAFDYTQQIQKEIQRNQTAKNLTTVLNDSGLATELKPADAVRKNTVKFIDNGKVRVFEVSPEIKRTIDNIAPYQLNTLEKIVAAPKRIFQAGTTGLSAPFTLANYVKDQIGSGINSKSALGRDGWKIVGTHAPQNILSGIWQASKDFGVQNNDPIWQKFIAHAGDTTQYDLLRGAKSAKRLSRELRRGEAGLIGNKITSPIKSLEDLVSVTEKATRFQNFKGIYNKVLKETGNEADAVREATLAAWQNSVDFNRYGNWGKTLNLLIPYFNSGIQGSRQLVRSFKNRPVATSIKSIATVGMPIAGVTAWNLQDPERKKVYDNISEFEKENSLVIIPPGPLTQNEDGTYNVWKIPVTPGYGSLFGGLRRAMESYADKAPNDFAAISKDIFNAVSGPIQLQGDLSKTASSLLPQAVKPLVQQAANKDFFTGKDIVPEYVNKATDAQGNPVPEAKKAFKYTSGSATKVGEALGVSPIRVEKFLKDSFGKVGQYGTNAIDNALAKAGVIKDEQIGGTSAKEDITRRFTKAQGEYNYMKSEGGKYFDTVKDATSKLNGNEKAAYDALHPSKTNFLGEDIFDENKRITSYRRAGTYLQYPKVYEADKAIDRKMREQGKPGNPMFDLPANQLTKVLLKATLPPGAKDPELSKLYEQPWYQDYQNARSKYYEGVKQSLAKEGKTLPPSDNPYPETPKDLQGVMDYYSSIPKGTGARSAWIQSNPDLWQKMTAQWAAVDAWENNERVAMGLEPIDNSQTSGFSSNKKNPTAAYTKVPQAQALQKVSLKSSTPEIRTKKSVKRRAKPKLQLKKSNV